MAAANWQALKLFEDFLPGQGIASQGIASEPRIPLPTPLAALKLRLRPIPFGH